jgi:hypothetical protein
MVVSMTWAGYLLGRTIPNIDATCTSSSSS